MSNSKIDEKWLGEGMYFWDNPSNAKYWKQEKTRKHKTAEHKIVSANLRLEKFLDLTNEDDFCGVERYWNLLSEELGLGDTDHVHIGEKLNYLFKYLSVFKETFDIVKIHAYYPKMQERIDISIRYTPCPSVTTQVRTIYTVRDKAAVSNAKYYKGKKFLEGSD